MLSERNLSARVFALPGRALPGRALPSRARPSWAASAFTLAALLTVALAPQAQAQALPVGALPPVPPPGSPLPGVISPATPSVAPAIAPQTAAPGEVSPSLTVPITSTSIAGATAYPVAVLAQYTAGLTGPSVPVAMIEAARTAMINRYRTDGYVYTAVNARISGGQLLFTVTEGRIVDVKLDGNIGPAGTQVLRFLDPLTETRPLTTKALERALLLASDVPGVTVHGVINPSADDPGALTLVAEVSRQVLTGQLQADNRAFRETGPEELLGIFDLNSFTSLGDLTQVSLYHTFNNTDSFGQISEDFFVGGSGLKFHFYGGAGQADPSSPLRDLGYNGFTTVFGGTISYPIIRARQQTLTITGLFDGVESDISTDVLGSRQRASFDSLRMLRADVEDVFEDNLLGPTRGADDFANLRLSQGLPILGASRDNNLQLPRLHEQVNFTKFNGELDRTQTLFPVGNFGTALLKLAAAGQYSDAVLPPEEKYYLGGPHFDRGFYYGQVTGDKALQTTVEPLFDKPLPTISFLPSPLSAEFYGFYDWGEVWQNETLDAGHTLRSAGGGVRLYIGERVEMDFEGVNRFTRYPNGTGPTISALPPSAFYWQLVDRF